MSLNVPTYFICPISKQIMEDPVLWMDGNTYERREIERWLEKHKINTATSTVPYRNVLFPNRAIKSGIETFLAEDASRSGKRKAAPEESTDITDRFICPLSERIMRDPVTCADGVTYERSEIERWLVACHTSPKTGNELRNKTLTSNERLKTELGRFDWEKYVRRTRATSFHIFVKTPAGPNIALDVHSNDRVSDIKLALYKRGQGLPEQQRLSFAGSRVEDNSLLSDCHIGEASHLLLTLQHDILHLSNMSNQQRVPTEPACASAPTLVVDSSEIILKMCDGEEVVHRLDLRATVMELKQRVQNRYGYPPDQQRVFYRGKQLEDERELVYYGVKHGHPLHIVFRLRGC